MVIDVIGIFFKFSVDLELAKFYLKVSIYLVVLNKEIWGNLG